MAESPRLSALKQLSKQLPVASQKVAAGQQAARDLQLQQAIKAAPQRMGAPAAQQMGTQLAAQAGQAQLASQEQGIQQQQQVAQLGAQAQQQDITSNLANLEAGQESKRLDNVQKFANLSEQAKQELFDSRMQFAKDNMNREFMNERQLADYAKLTAKSDEQFQSYAQEAKQQNDMRIQSLETINRRLKQAMQNDFAREQEGLDRMSQQQIYEMQRDVEARIAKAKADAANKTAAWGAVGTVVGTVVGAYFGGAGGAQAGGALGGAGGSAAGSSQAQPGLQSEYSGAKSQAGGV